MSITIPYVTKAWHWLGAELQRETAAKLQEQRHMDTLAQQSDFLPSKVGLKALSAVHGLTTWVVKTPSALAYGSVDFIATAATDIPAALRAIPETIQHSGNEIFAGGALLASGNFSEGLSRILDGVTGDMMIILGARGLVKATPSLKASRPTPEMAVRAAPWKPTVEFRVPQPNLIDQSTIELYKGRWKSTSEAPRMPSDTVIRASAPARIYFVKNGRGGIFQIQVELFDNGKAGLTYDGTKARQTVFIEAPGATIGARFSAVDQYVNIMIEGPGVTVSVLDYSIPLSEM